jgi:hypothetical protein
MIWTTISFKIIKSFLKRGVIRAFSGWCLCSNQVVRVLKENFGCNRSYDVASIETIDYFSIVLSTENKINN